MKLRRFLLFLVAMAVLAAVAIVGLGLRSFPPDTPAQPSAAVSPGDGGLRRPFPAMAVRPDSPVTPKRVEISRFFLPQLQSTKMQAMSRDASITF